jgi:hypothetical protein
MRRWLVRLLVERVYSAMRDGRPEPALRMFKPDIRFRFVGTHSWAIDTDDAGEVRSWFERFTALRPDLRTADLVVSGPPWRMSVCVVFDDALHNDVDEVTYSNHGVQYLQLRWGRVILDEINLDTQRVADFDVRAAPSRPG